MRRTALSLLLLAVVIGPLRAADPPWESAPTPDARVRLDVACSWGRIVVKQGRTVVYEPAADAKRPEKKSGRDGGKSGALSKIAVPTTLKVDELVKDLRSSQASTLAPKPQPVSDERFPPSYVAVTTGEAFLKIEAGLGNYEVSIELRMPRHAHASTTTKADP